MLLCTSSGRCAARLFPWRQVLFAAALEQPLEHYLLDRCDRVLGPTAIREVRPTISCMQRSLILMRYAQAPPRSSSCLSARSDSPEMLPSDPPSFFRRARRRCERTSNPRSLMTCSTQLRFTRRPFSPPEPPPHPPIAVRQFLRACHHDLTCVMVRVKALQTCGARFSAPLEM